MSTSALDRDATDTSLKLITQHSLRPGEICIEIDEEHHSVYREVKVNEKDPWDAELHSFSERTVVAGNRNVNFQPVDTRSFGGNSVNYVRSRQILERFMGRRGRFSMAPWLDGLDYIPGERIHIDLERKIGRITDAIFDAENTSLREKLKAAWKKRDDMKAPLWPGIYTEVDLSADPIALWQWVWHMRLICDGDPEHNGGPSHCRGCATDGPRLCRPVQNVDLLPRREECLASRRLRMRLPAMSQRQYDCFVRERAESDPDSEFNPHDWTITQTPWSENWVATMPMRHM